MPSVQSLPNTRTRRNTACAMLFVWLFALASGLVNACLLEPSVVRDHGPALSHPSATGTALGSAGDHAQGLTHDVCLKACDDGSQTLLKHASSVELADPGLVLFAAAAWAAEVHVAPASGRAHDFRLQERGRPIRVLFSRLAI